MASKFIFWALNALSIVLLGLRNIVALWPEEIGMTEGCLNTMSTSRSQ